MSGDWEWCGQAHHFVGANNCRFHLATWVGGGRFLVSTVGDYRPEPDRQTMTTLGAGDDSFFETYVFATDPDNREVTSGHPEVSDWCEVGGERWATHEEANEGHMRYCREFEAKS
jgi:hypothetical protein